MCLRFAPGHLTLTLLARYSSVLPPLTPPPTVVPGGSRVPPAGESTLRGGRSIKGLGGGGLQRSRQKCFSDYLLYLLVRLRMPMECIFILFVFRKQVHQMNGCVNYNLPHSPLISGPLNPPRSLSGQGWFVSRGPIKLRDTAAQMPPPPVLGISPRNRIQMPPGLYHLAVPLGRLSQEWARGSSQAGPLCHVHVTAVSILAGRGESGLLHSGPLRWRQGGKRARPHPLRSSF